MKKLSIPSLVLVLAACSPEPIPTQQTNAIRLAEFAGVGENGQIRIESYGTTQQGLDSIPVVQNGIPNNGPMNTMEVVTDSVMVNCPALTFCGEVTVRSFYVYPVDSVYAEITVITPPTGHAVVNGEPPGTAGLDGSLGLFSYGNLATVGLPNDASQEQWIFEDLNGTNFSFRGVLWGALPPVEEVLLLAADTDAARNEVRDRLNDINAFPTIDTFDARAATPTAAQLAAYDAVLVWSDGVFFDGTALGNLLADFYDIGGVVVVAAFANGGWSDLSGRFVLEDYMLLNESTFPTFPSDALGTVHDPTSPLMENVTAFAASTAFASPGSPVNGGSAVASWASGRPLIVEGRVGGRRRADLNFYPLSSRIDPRFWTGDGAQIIRNALIYR